MFSYVPFAGVVASACSLESRRPLQLCGTQRLLDYRLRALVRAALRAASLLPAAPLVRTAFRAALFSAAGPRWRALLRACLASAAGDAAAWPSRSSARCAALDRVGDGFRPVALGAFFPPGGGGRFTPARRALDSPMAIACLVDRAPCLP